MAITIYSKPNCVQCTATYRAMDKAGLSYETVDISLDAQALEQVKSLGYGRRVRRGLRPRGHAVSSGPLLVYFSSTSENTHRFVGKLGFPTARIPLRRTEPPLTVDEEYVLVVPTYGGGSVKGAVPKQVIAFLNNPNNRALCRGVIASGNTNFGQAYCLAGDIIASKLGVPFLYRYELLGTPTDVARVKEGLEDFWQTR